MNSLILSLLCYAVTAGFDLAILDLACLIV